MRPVFWVVIDHFDNSTGEFVSDLRRMCSRWSEVRFRDRPHYNGGWCLDDELHEWLVDRNLQYRLEWFDSNWVVGVEDPALALMIRKNWPLDR